MSLYYKVTLFFNHQDLYQSSINKGIRHIHFIGIGGIGMSAIALVLAKNGFQVSGSDKKTNQSIIELKKNGVKIFEDQNAKNIQTIINGEAKKPIIVISTAITPENEELKEAQNLKLEIYHRSDILAWLIKKQSSIVVAGSHGKTTTSSLITTLLALNKKDPTAIIGGIVPFYNSNSHAGKGKFIVAEGDESDGTIVKLEGEIGVITNLELDHTNYYKDLESLKNTIRKFSSNCKHIIANYDCNNLNNNLDEKTLFWSIKEVEGINFAAIPIEINGRETLADFYEDGKYLGPIKIPLTGLHNLSNAVAAISACRVAGLSFKELQNKLPDLQAPSRRFDFKGIWKGRQIVDDYAHHPSEIKATISMARLLLNTKNKVLPEKAKRIIIIFQPHRYSRTKDLINDFAISLTKADVVFLAPIYSAGEEVIEGVNIQTISSLIKNKNKNLPVYTSNNFKGLIESLEENTLKSDLLVFMGAGDINKLSEELIDSSNKNKAG